MLGIWILYIIRKLPFVKELTKKSSLFGLSLFEPRYNLKPVTIKFGLWCKKKFYWRIITLLASKSPTV